MDFDEMIESWKANPEPEDVEKEYDQYGITVPVLGDYKVTDEEFNLKKDAYVAEHGYTVHIPEVTDVIKIGWFKEPDEAELEAYHDKSLQNTDYPRWLEIREENLKRQRKYMNMLGSPTPNIARSAGSIMNMLDDVNDTLGTGAVLLRTAGYLGSRIGLKFLMGPAGWLLLGADIFGIAMQMQTALAPAIFKKNAMDEIGAINPFSKKSRAVRASKLRRLKPSKGEFIEMAQTTNQFIGIGLCLGPLVGLAQDVAFGTWRVMKGEKVSIKGSPAFMNDRRVRSAVGVLNAAHLLFQDHRTMENEDYYKTMVALNYATQITHPYLQEWNPIDQIEGIEFMEKEAPGVTRPLTKLACEEVGQDPEPLRNWAVPGSRFATHHEIYDQGIYWAGDTIMKICNKNKQSMDCLMSAQNAELFSRSIVDSLEGGRTTLRDTDPSYKFIKQTFMNGFNIPANITPYAIRSLEIWIKQRGWRKLGTNWQQMCWKLNGLVKGGLPFEVPYWWIYSGWHYFQQYPEEFLDYASWAGIPWREFGYRERVWIQEKGKLEWSYRLFYPEMFA